MSGTVLLVGCGRMGGALLRAWAAEDVMVLDPAAQVPAGVRRVATAREAAEGSRPLVIVLAVKPQMLGTVLPDLAPLVGDGALVVSIVAGAPLAELVSALGSGARVVRAMPNTPAAIGRGITALVADDRADDADRARAEALLRAAGEVVWLDAEAQMDAVTAVSGSGPAFFFRFAEALAVAGRREGLSPELAMRLARATFTGAAALADADDQPLAALREAVTSPGGTTAAGLARLDDGGAIDALASATVAAAAARSRALA